MLPRITLTCVPTLAPLFTYFSKKSSNTYSRDYYSNAPDLRSHGEASRINHIASTSKLAQDADSDSQKVILDSKSSLKGKRGPQRPDITKTVQIDVEYMGSMPDGPNGKMF
jgi:hypothetical protein